MPLASTLGRPIAAPTTPTLAANTMARKLGETKDVKAFVLDALKQPEQGGAYYALLASEACKQGFKAMKSGVDDAIKSVVEKEGTISPERMAAINAVADRCIGFSEGEAGTLQAEASRLGIESRDPLYALLLAVLNAEGAPEYDKAIEATFTSGSAALLSTHFFAERFFRMTSTDTNGVITTRFNGQSYVSKTDRDILSAGASLGACVEGEYCEIDQQMRMQCGGLGNCYATREEYMREQWLSGDKASLDRAMKIAEQIRQAIARGDSWFFH